MSSRGHLRHTIHRLGKSHALRPNIPTPHKGRDTSVPYFWDSRKYCTPVLYDMAIKFCKMVDLHEGNCFKGSTTPPDPWSGPRGGGQNFCDPQHFIIPFDLDDWLFIALNVIFLGQRLWAFVRGSQNAEALEPRSLGRGVADP